MIVTEHEAPPPVAQQPTVDVKPKCWRCTKTLAGYMTRPWSIKCQRCNALNKSEPE